MFNYFFFFNDTATTEIYTLSLHDALPIWKRRLKLQRPKFIFDREVRQIHEITVSRILQAAEAVTDRKSTRLNSSHSQISYAVFCLKKKKRIIVYRFITY